MSERASMMHPPIEELHDRVDSKFTLVSLAAKRGRQINSYFSQLGEGLGAIVPPQVASVSRKPLSIALEEIAADKIRFTRIEEAPDEGAGDAVADDVPVDYQPLTTVDTGDAAEDGGEASS